MLEERHLRAAHAAHRTALEILARVYPLVAPADPALEAWRTSRPEDFELLPGAKALTLSGLGLTPGSSQEQSAFAAARGLALLRVSARPPEIQSLVDTYRTEQRSGDVVETDVVSNDQAVNGWVQLVNGLVSEIERLDDRIELTRDASQHVSETRKSADTWYVGGGWTATNSSPSENETLGSMMARGRALDRLTDLERERDALMQRYERLMAERPASEQVQYRNRTFTCAIEHQTWTMKYETVVRIEGGAEPVELPILTSWERTGIRNPESPALGIAATDDWITEGRMRAETKVMEEHLPEIVRAALRSYADERMREYEAELLARELTEPERTTELAWLHYFFTPSDREAEPPASMQAALVEHAMAR